MIGRLQGILLEKHPPDILLDVNGVGYEISMPMNSFYQLPEVNHSSIIYTHFIVREDAQLLYGFITQTERLLFREVIKANGIGPKLGLAILSAMTTKEFVECVERENVSRLVKIPGVGKKTAERLVIEMRDRLKTWSEIESTLPLLSNTEKTSNRTFLEQSQDEAIRALIALGYKTVQAEKTVRKVAQTGMQSEDIIRSALRSMV